MSTPTQGEVRRSITENVRGHVSGAIRKIRSLAGIVSLAEKYQDVFSSPQGRDVLRHICKVGHIFESTYVQGDPHATTLREGERRLALSILRAVNRDTTELIKQVEESLKEN